MDLFAGAKKKQPKKAVKATNDKLRIEVDAKYFDKIKEVQKLEATLKAAKAKSEILKDELKEIGKEKWIENMEENDGANPGSFMLVVESGDETAQVMFLPTDKYIKIDADRAEELIEEYDEDIVTENTTYKFNATQLQKYGSVISGLISESEDIKESDKSKIIEADTAFTVAKGTVNKMKKFGDIETIVEEIRPIVMLKGAEVIK